MKDEDNINDYIPSLLNPKTIRKKFSLTQNSISRCSLSLSKLNRTQHNVTVATNLSQVNQNKENSPNVGNLISGSPIANRKTLPNNDRCDYTNSLGFSAIEDLFSRGSGDSLSLTEFQLNRLRNKEGINKNDSITNEPNTSKAKSTLNNECHKFIISISSATELEDNGSTASEFSVINVKPSVKLSFEVNDCESVNVNAKNGAIRNFVVSHKENSTNIDCELLQSSQSTDIEIDENMNETSSSPLKRSAVVVDLEIKKQKLTHNVSAENPKVLILNTNAIEKISHVIIQPPNYTFVKRNISQSSNYKKKKLYNGNGEIDRGKLKQVSIESFVRKETDATIDVGKQLGLVNNAEEMSKNSGVYEGLKCDRGKSRMIRRDANESPKSARLPSKKDLASPKKLEIIKTTNSDAPSPRIRNECSSAHSPRKNIESLHFNLPVKSMSNKTPLSPRHIPHHKIVAGTHFAVDAFSYGDIPNVKHYFLTHFHSDHYTGLKKGFNKLLFCSKITADLCISRLGIHPKSIHIINVDETIKIDGVEIAAVDANHCPGALMLVFTLPNGKTLLHTGDFRAAPSMESYPVFWNRDIHTIYLDTTYCNPRYDFPTQEQSLEMALYILRQKKMALEKVGKKFSSVLIVCGTYTIGKEKFFLGVSRRVGCCVWACAEKERVLQTVEGRAGVREPPHACQLHLVPMRDLTHEKLRAYLDSLNGAFTEVVAFKPSGWENGKNSSVEKDSVTIHGIPYSEHSSFSELIRFVKFLKPKQVVPTVDISGGVKAVQKYFPCPLVQKDEMQYQTRVTDYFSIHSRAQSTAVT